jgi:hypothetical protein
MHRMGKNYEETLVADQRERIREALDAFSRELMVTLSVGVALNDADVGEWISGATEALLPNIESSIFLGNLPDLPLYPTRQHIDDMRELDLSDRIEASDAQSALDDLRERVEESGIGLDTYEEDIERFLERIVEEAGDRIAVADTAVDDFITDDLLGSITLPDWLNDSIDWDKVYVKVRSNSDQISHPDGEDYYLILPEPRY